jgi:uncharacterized protein YbaR (Trm112 family)
MNTKKMARVKLRISPDCKQGYDVNQAKKKISPDCKQWYDVNQAKTVSKLRLTLKW